MPSLLHVVSYDLLCPLATKTLPSGAPCRERAGVACRQRGCVPWLGVARLSVQRWLTDLSVFARVIGVSRWVADRLHAEGVRVDEVVPNGIPTRPRRPPLGERPSIGFAGRLVKKKGVDVLLAATAELLRRVPSVRLVVVGDGPERALLEALAASLRIDHAVEFVGHVDRATAEQILDVCWLQAVPSVWEEPFGLVAAEAMMRGTAVVASGSGGLTEQVVDGETGYLVPPGDASALAHALERVVVDRDLAERLGDAGRRRALAELTEDRYVDRILAIYARMQTERP